jgi:hypothetical protein
LKAFFPYAPAASAQLPAAFHDYKIINFYLNECRFSIQSLITASQAIVLQPDSISRFSPNALPMNIGA